MHQALVGINYTLQPGDVVMIQTGAAVQWGQPQLDRQYPPPVSPVGQEYFAAGCGMGRDATIWLIDHGIRVMGTDAWTWAPPFWKARELFGQTSDPSVIWEGHRAGREREYCQIEKLANLDRLPHPYGFTVSCFPVKTKGGSGGWRRAVAFFPGVIRFPCTGQRCIRPQVNRCG